MAIENAPDVRQLLRRAHDEPGAAAEQLPELVATLDHDDRSVRIGAAWAICAVAESRPDTRDPIRSRLRGHPRPAGRLAAEWIRTVLVESEDGEASGVPDRPEPATETDAGETEGEQTDADLPSGGHRAEDRPTGQASTSGRPSGPHEEGDDAAESDEEDEDDGPAVDSGPAAPPGTDEVVSNGRFTIPLDRTVFDGLSIVERATTDRHAWTYVGMATVDAERHAVLVRSYREPRGARLANFASAFQEVFSRWAGVDDHENVLTVYDHGRRPHPWVVTEYARTTLREAGRLPVASAFRVGLDAALGLAHAHERGVTHRSLDPRSVAIASVGGRASGRLLNLGLVDAFRAVDGPLPLDSRYAAPELFGDEYGGIDHLTDVYQLGAVLYTALTGQPPYEDSLVQRGGPDGLTYEPPSSVVDGVPIAADRIVAKAMATHKIARYESADELVQDLRGALREVEDRA